VSDPERPTKGPAPLSVWRRDYRLSIVLLAAGVVLVATVAPYSWWANSTGNYPTSFWLGLAVYVLGAAGGMLVLLAGTVAYYHRAGLRHLEGNT
jgi:hypothetical protein